MTQKQIRFPELEAKVEKIMRTAAQKAALAAKGKPLTREMVIFLYRTIHMLVQSALDTVNFQLQAKANALMMRKGMDDAEDDLPAVQKRINANEEKAAMLSPYARKDAGKLHRLAATALLILLCLGDSIFNQRGLERLLGLNYITSLIVAAVVASFLAYLAHGPVPKYVKAPEGNPIRRMAVVMGLAVFVFGVLGSVRMDGLPDTLDEILRVVAFTLLSTLSYFAACHIGIWRHEAEKNAPTEEEIRAARELGEIESAISRDKAELAKTKSDTREQEAYTALLWNYGLGLKQKIVTDGRGIFFDYLKLAFNDRHPETDPTIFNFPEYPFEFVMEIQPEAKSRKTGTGSTMAILLLATCLLPACSENVTEPSGDVAVTVLVDNSFYSGNYPDGPALVKFVGLDKEMWRGELRIEIGKISDVDYEQSYVHILEGAERWNSNLESRQDSIRSFTDEVSGSIRKVLPPEGAELHNSVIYRTVARHALEQKKLPYKRKFLLVWSDLMNHDAQVSFYGKQGRKALANHTKLEEIFASQVPLGDLSGVTIIFIHRPNGPEANADFMAASGFFTSMFSNHSADVRVCAALPDALP